MSSEEFHLGLYDVQVITLAFVALLLVGHRVSPCAWRQGLISRVTYRRSVLITLTSLPLDADDRLVSTL